MTEQQAEVFAQRLARIWSFTGVCAYELLRDEDGEWRFCFSGEINAGVVLRVEVTSYRSVEMVLQGNYGQLFWRDNEAQVGWARLHPLMNLLTSPRPTLWGLIIGALRPRNRPANWEAKAKDFRDKWMDFFRRGCWLSGCNIDASAHEKMEWMQGFTQEEVEAWDLNF